MGGAVDALYDVIVDLDPQCREALDREWESLLEYHNSMPSGERDFDASVRQMQFENPLTSDPIIDRAGAPEARVVATAPVGEGGSEKPNGTSGSRPARHGSNDS